MTYSASWAPCSNKGRGVPDITAASAAAVAQGMRITFAVAAALVTLAMVLSSARRVRHLTLATLVVLATVSAARAHEQGRILARSDLNPAVGVRPWGQSPWPHLASWTLTPGTSWPPGLDVPNGSPGCMNDALPPYHASATTGDHPATAAALRARRADASAAAVRTRS